MQDTNKQGRGQRTLAPPNTARRRKVSASVSARLLASLSRASYSCSRLRRPSLAPAYHPFRLPCASVHPRERAKSRKRRAAAASACIALGRGQASRPDQPRARAPYSVIACVLACSPARLVGNMHRPRARPHGRRQAALQRGPRGFRNPASPDNSCTRSLVLRTARRREVQGDAGSSAESQDQGLAAG